MIEMSKDKNFIKQRIKKLCLTNNRMVPNFDYASLYDRVMVTGGYDAGELGLSMIPRGYTNTNPCLEVMLPTHSSYRRRGYLYDDGSVNYRELSYSDFLENNDYEF